MVEREMHAEAAEAAKDWQRVTHQYGARDFSAGPAANLRLGVNGLKVVVRYITHVATQRVKVETLRGDRRLLREPA